MSTQPRMETFPPLSPSAHMIRKTSSQDVTRRRRKSSGLGADPRGDTAAGSITTNLPRQPNSNASTSPTERKTERAPRERKRTRAKKLYRRWKRICFKHTWLLPLVLLLVILAAYFVRPGEHNPLHSALFLSYANPPLNERTNTLPPHIGNVTQYGKGRADFAFVAFYTLVLTFTREFLMQRLIRPIAVRCGIRRRAKQSRFMEQFYTAIYFTIFSPFGLWVMSRTPVWYFNTAGMYEGFPHRAHDGWFKAYYLLQAAYWTQQMLVLLLQLEAPRKDFRELVLHHIITVSLIGLSYRFHFAYMGVAVYITHDISDFFIATSKLLNYIDSPLTGPYYVFFLCIWAYLRHYINLTILASLLPPYTFPSAPTSYPSVDRFLPANTSLGTGKFATVGPFELNWETQQYKCWISQIITFGLLAALQAVNIVWFFLLIRILVRYLFAGEKKDERSEDEGDEEEEVSLVEPVAVQVDGNGSVVKPQSPPGIEVNGKPVGGNYITPKTTGREANGGEKAPVRRKR
ncbi:hypothetical protein LTR85_009458 [Meristemomyces frigidus]|nr:hypothetical protein LTR85_009458 [Meristemomyces frigidus]